MYNCKTNLVINDINCEENLFEIIIYSSTFADEKINIIRSYFAERHRIRLENNNYK